MTEKELQNYAGYNILKSLRPLPRKDMCCVKRRKNQSPEPERQKNPAQSFSHLIRGSSLDSWGTRGKAERHDEKERDSHLPEGFDNDFARTARKEMATNHEETENNPPEADAEIKFRRRRGTGDIYVVLQLP